MFFHVIRIDPPKQRIYQRLGYRLTVTQLSPEQQKQTDDLIGEASSLITLQGSVIRLPITAREEGMVTLEDRVHLASRRLASFLRECDEVLIMGATAGGLIMEAIEESLAKDQMSRTVIYDATASEMTDAALDWLMDYHRQTLVREGRELLNRRYSAGYGDFALENQQIFYALLDLGAIGIRITPESLLVPEKSVTAVTGIARYGITTN